MRDKYIIFFIGTIAEYIKMFPLIEEVKAAGVPYKVIVSGQNNIETSDIARSTNLHTDLILSDENSIVKNVFGLFFWFFKTMIKSKSVIKNTFADVDFARSVMVVHGDTLSTVMGAVLGKRLKMKVAHIEAGLRSHNFFSPFPEELDRLLVSKTADYNYCQGASAEQNLKNAKGAVINTQYNTIIDAIAYARRQSVNNPLVHTLAAKDYGIVVLHRQENLLNRSFVEKIVHTVMRIAEGQTILFVMHQITEDTLKRFHLYDTLCNTPNIIAVRRQEYFDFMNLLWNSRFVITDGGSNQEELSYMGKPTLILRTATERNEGIGDNALMFNGDVDALIRFADSYQSYARNPVVPSRSPSKLICAHLVDALQKM